jgi:hypothetical protein
VTFLSYHRVAFGLCDARVYFFIVTSRGARTVRHISIGDRLAAAQRAYPTLLCGSSTGDTTDPPVPVYRYCTGSVASQRFVWFGHDPIRSIAVASVRLGG